LKGANLDESLVRIRWAKGGEVHPERLDDDASLRNAPPPELTGDVSGGDKHDVTELEVALNAPLRLGRNELVMIVRQASCLSAKPILMIGMTVEAVEHGQDAELSRAFERCHAGRVHADDCVARDVRKGRPRDRSTCTK
jgi:hypothetical protein